jgi:hypothetical protein
MNNTPKPNDKKKADKIYFATGALEPMWVPKVEAFNEERITDSSESARSKFDMEVPKYVLLHLLIAVCKRCLMKALFNRTELASARRFCL